MGTNGVSYKGKTDSYTRITVDCLKSGKWFANFIPLRFCLEHIKISSEGLFPL
ncbi:hypothetical protein Pint_24230 [Pistacia integerrima]|uniref:Uncharacterized protein n=1 Tax=Pistacia integerrima TaxID=434235 RepID=A0ACC0YBR7_9ROSI|nr:hypothetical protein Pint_24230 [Pistacia integerrima]